MAQNLQAEYWTKAPLKLGLKCFKIKLNKCTCHRTKIRYKFIIRQGLINNLKVLWTIKETYNLVKIRWNKWDMMHEEYFERQQVCFLTGSYFQVIPLSFSLSLIEVVCISFSDLWRHSVYGLVKLGSNIAECNRFRRQNIIY